MRTLILSCSTGQGHNSCAGAIAEVYRNNGQVCESADSLSFVSEGFSRFLSWGHTTMYRRLPWLFRWGYGYFEKHSAMLRENSMIYKLLTCGTRRLREYIVQGQFEAVICTHVFSALQVTAMLREQPMALKTAFVATDYTCYPGIGYSALDLYFIPAESLAGGYRDAGILDRKIVCSGIPIRRMFLEAGDKGAAKERFGIEADCPHLLMVCGSMGCGPMKQLAKQLSRAGTDFEVTIVCGTNDKLRRTLEKRCVYRPHIHILGYVKDMAGLMDSADVYLTKPGGLSVTEAAAKHLPMVFIDAVAGCEEYNRRYYVRQGSAMTGSGAEEAAAQCLQLLRNEDKRRQMAQALQECQTFDAAQVIFTAMTAGTGDARKAANTLWNS